MASPRQKLFRVIVLGGVALVDCGARTDLGGRAPRESWTPIADASDEDAIGFPEETAFAFDAGAPPDDAGAADEVSFPGEANAPPAPSGSR